MTVTTGAAQVRPAAAADADDIARVGRQAFYEAFAHSCTEQDMVNFLDSHYVPSVISSEIDNPQRSYLVAVVDGRVVAFSSLAFDSDEPCVKAYPNRVELQRIYVDKDHHGQGVAKALTDATLELARTLDKQYIWLGVWGENFRARRFYEKLGFEKVGEHVFTVGSDDQTDWIVIRKL
jgi:ribosomal protein S18 acetylase RimI-like enzyme